MEKDKAWPRVTWLSAR